MAKALDAAGAYCRVDFVGGFSALVQKGVADGDRVLIDSLPDVLTQTKSVCASVNAASRQAGINMDALKRLGEVISEIAHADMDNNGFAAAKLVVFSNIPEDNPFMAGAYMGAGEPEATINIGVSGPGVVDCALQRRIATAKESGKKLTLLDLAEEIKIASFRVTRIGELIGREVADRLNTSFGVDPRDRRLDRRNPQDARSRARRRARFHRRDRDAQRRGQEGRTLRLWIRRRSQRRLHPRFGRLNSRRRRRQGASFP